MSKWKMDVLRSVYPFIESLKEWIVRVKGGTAISLRTLEESKSMTIFLESTIVCCHDNKQEVRGCTHESTHPELVLRVIEKLMKKPGKKNLLSLGFMKPSPHCSVATSSRVAMTYPNALCSSLYLPKWSRLHSVVGDEMMIALLENAAIFVPVKNASFAQITGIPLYHLPTLTPPLPPTPSPKTSTDSFCSILTKKCKISSKTLTNPKRRKIKHDFGNEVHCCNKKISVSILRVLYAKDLKARIPSSAMISCSIPTDDGINKLLQSILDTDIGETSCSQGLLETLKQSLAPILKKFLEKHRKLRQCMYAKYLSHCHQVETNVSELSTAEILERTLHHRQVWLWLRLCVLKTFPVELLGRKNTAQFMNNLKEFVSLGRYAEFTLNQLMYSIQVNCVQWTEDSNCKSCLIGRLLWWMLQNFIMPLLKGYLYVTESSTYRCRIFFFLKSDWSIVVNRKLKDDIDSGLIQPISRMEANQTLSGSDSLKSINSMRFLPKSSSLRSIMQMKRIKQQSKLKDLLVILRQKRESRPCLTGCSVFGLNEIHRMWKEFVDRHEKYNRNRELYFVKIDLKNCFESIKTDLLLDMLESLFQNEKINIVQRFSITSKCGTTLKKNFFRKAKYVDNLLTRPEDFAASEIVAKRLSQVVFCDQVLYDEYSKDDFLSMIRTLLNRSVFKVGYDYYRLRQGLIQGAATSTMLCNMYYAAVEQRFLTVDPVQDLLMRQVDDFLFVSPNIQRAKLFLQQMKQGFPEFNCTINSNKTVVNFTSSHESIPSSAQFPWCGLLIDPNSLEISVDYSRYSGLALRDVVVPTSQSGNTSALKTNLKFTMQSQCRKIFFDPQINSLRRILVNIKDLFVLTSLKLHCLRHSSQPTDDLIDVICAISTHVFNSVRHAYRSSKEPLPEQMRKAIDWLCCEVFSTTFRRHQGQYHETIKLLKKSKNSLMMTSLLLSHCKEICQRVIPVYFDHVIH